MRCSHVTLVCLLTVTVATARAELPDRPMQPTPAAQPAKTPQGAATATRVAAELMFTEPSGATLGTRNVEVALGRTETVSIQQGARTVSAEVTVSAAAKAGCHRIDVTVRDKTINATGQFNKTVWQSGSEPCGEAVFTLGPKAETRIRVTMRPIR